MNYRTIIIAHGTFILRGAVHVRFLHRLLALTGVPVAPMILVVVRWGLCPTIFVAGLTEMNSEEDGKPTSLPTVPHAVCISAE